MQITIDITRPQARGLYFILKNVQRAVGKENISPETRAVNKLVDELGDKLARGQK